MSTIHLSPRTITVLPLSVLLFISIAAPAFAQAGRRSGTASTERATTISVVAKRANENADSQPLTADDVALYDDSIEQRIQNFRLDQSPARIVLLVDNSETLRTEVDQLAAAVREFAYEIFEGDQLMVVGYDEKAEIVSDWTDDAKILEASLGTLRKKGQPFLFDALSATLDQALAPLSAASRKRVIIVIGDGLDRGSKIKYAQIVTQLQRTDVTVYALQLPDRTGGALRRDTPKPAQVINQITEATGGLVLPFNEPRKAAQTICDELRKNRYILAYTPQGVSPTDARRLLITANDQQVTIRAKAMQPAQ